MIGDSGITTIKVGGQRREREVSSASQDWSENWHGEVPARLLILNQTLDHRLIYLGSRSARKTNSMHTLRRLNWQVLSARFNTNSQGVARFCSYRSKSKQIFHINLCNALLFSWSSFIQPFINNSLCSKFANTRNFITFILSTSQALINQFIGTKEY